MDKEETTQVRPNERIPIIFSNNIVVGTTLTEMVITFALGTTPHQLVYLSLPVAKNLGKLINDSIADYERKMSLTITSVDELFEQQISTENASNTQGE